MRHVGWLALMATAAAAQVPCQVPGPCDDGNVCTSNDTCNGTFCVGTKVSCNDHDVCTDDLCNPQTGCFHAFNSGPCDDGNACTSSDSCNGAGACQGGPPTLCPDDNNPCTTESCTPALGCHTSFNSAPCNDGNACTLADRCALGSCQGTPKSCDDGNPCTADVCNQDLGGACETFALDAGVCSDGDLCSTNDHCFSGLCVGGGPVTCADDGNPCTSEFCASDAGCGRVLNTATCDDGDFCTVGDRCNSSVCVGGLPRSCEDANECTVDVCSTDAGACVHFAGPTETAPCNDGNACTLSDQCFLGVCQAGPPRLCNDGNACTDDTCVPTTGACASSNDDTNPCSDGNACTSADRCSAGSCVGGGAVTCADDGNPCTSEFCAPDAGCGFAFNTASCDDSNFCTVNDRCSAGVCVPGALRDCEDGNRCTRQRCDVDAGTADGGFGVCFVYGPDPFSGERWPCDDGNACTLGDVCDFTATCQPGTPRVCNDGNACTDDTCVPTTGACLAVNDDTNACADGNACTLDRCSAGSCVASGTVSCPDDANPCTSPFCAPDAGCGFAFNTASCDDSNFCTVNDRCSAGVCVPGALRDCEDGNRCTRQSCDVDAGTADGGFGVCFVYGPDPFSGERWPCDDGNACTLGDVCDFTATCQPGTPRSCDDGDACTMDLCEPTSGSCVRTPEPTCGDGGADAGVDDAGAGDAGVRADAGLADAGGDAGAVSDAGPRDAGTGPGERGGCSCTSVDPLASFVALFFALRLGGRRRR